jgi:hypothetical protein
MAVQRTSPSSSLTAAKNVIGEITSCSEVPPARRCFEDGSAVRP